ncbi:MAG TPA: hypothetical protein PLE33_08705 [Candidatus Cloacimonas sp.]|nr:hypothetical protein [Candidatus Cloacimonas sp.]HPS61321.1 hypothetical protein [Candidatus Cloacimonas sp.]
MADEKEVVNTEEATNSEETKEVVKESAETTSQETTETTEPVTQEQGQAPEAVDGTGVPWKNRAMEWQRKAQENTSEDNIRKVAQELLNQQKQQPQEREYSIAELEQFAIDRPDQRPWVEEQKARLIGKNIARITEEKVKEVEKKQKAEATYQQSMQWVNNHPRVQECFIKDPFGRKVWNNQHPLTNLIAMYSNDPDLKNRPDAPVIATKLALADYMDSQSNTTQKKVKSLEQNLKKVQKGTLIEGNASQQDVIKGKTRYSKAMENLHSTGTKEALREVLKAKLGIE